MPIIAVTSYALSGDEAKTREAGCDGYVAKPFSPRQLLAKVREFLPVRTEKRARKKPPLILIADDNEANREILARRLEAHGYQLVMAADGEEVVLCDTRAAARPDPAFSTS